MKEKSRFAEERFFLYTVFSSKISWFDCGCFHRAAHMDHNLHNKFLDNFNSQLQESICSQNFSGTEAKKFVDESCRCHGLCRRSLFASIRGAQEVRSLQVSLKNPGSFPAGFVMSDPDRFRRGGRWVPSPNRLIRSYPPPLPNKIVSTGGWWAPSPNRSYRPPLLRTLLLQSLVVGATGQGQSLLAKFGVASRSREEPLVPPVRLHASAGASPRHASGPAAKWSSLLQRRGVYPNRDDLGKKEPVKEGKGGVEVHTTPSGLPSDGLPDDLASGAPLPPDRVAKEKRKALVKKNSLTETLDKIHRKAIEGVEFNHERRKAMQGGEFNHERMVFLGGGELHYRERWGGRPRTKIEIEHLSTPTSVP